MKISVKPAAILGVAGAIFLATPVVSKAQMMYGPGDTWAHIATPTPEGFCWIPTDLGAYKEFGYGYWGACPPSVAPRTAAQARAEALRARAEVPIGLARPTWDTWAHIATPTPNGLCWIPTDLGYVKEFGYGYWGACPASVMAPQAMRARAQATKPSRKKQYR